MCTLEMDGVCPVWRETHRVARKPRRCASCHSQIEKGERYLYHYSVYDGNNCSEGLCIMCEIDREVFASEHNDQYMTPGYFTNMLSSCIHEGDEESQKWEEMWERIKARTP